MIISMRVEMLVSELLPCSLRQERGTAVVMEWHGSRFFPVPMLVCVGVMRPITHVSQQTRYLVFFLIISLFSLYH